MLTTINIFGQSTSWLEVIAMLTGIVGVLLTIKQNIWCFPVGIINVALYAYFFFSPGIRLYADALLQCIYIILLLYGWFKWNKKIKEAKESNIVKLDFKKALLLFTIAVVSTIILANILIQYTDATFTWIDSSLTCASLVAQWMIAKKIIENWIVWIIVDAIYIPLYLTKGLSLTAVLYGLFLILAVKGFIEWKKSMSANAI
jgi:nicotinamide mononucleotide transporter